MKIFIPSYGIAISRKIQELAQIESRGGPACRRRFQVYELDVTFLDAIGYLDVAKAVIFGNTNKAGSTP